MTNSWMPLIFLRNEHEDQQPICKTTWSSLEKADKGQKDKDEGNRGIQKKALLDQKSPSRNNPSPSSSQGNAYLLLCGSHD